jgi:predicted RNA binding protein YcfA (HicA-like mRNA interferase family)
MVATAADRTPLRNILDENGASRRQRHDCRSLTRTRKPGSGGPWPAARTGRRAVTRLGLRIPPMSTVTRRALTAWLVDHGFAELGGKATSHRRFRHESGVVITVPGHGRQNLSQKHVGMIVRQLEDAGFDRDTVRRDLNAR